MKFVFDNGWSIIDNIVIPAKTGTIENNKS